MGGVVRAHIQVTIARELLPHEHDRRTLNWVVNPVGGKEHQIHDIMSTNNASE